MNITIAGRTFDLDRALTPEGRSKLLADPAVVELIGRVQRNPAAFGLNDLDVLGLESWMRGDFDGATAETLRASYAGGTEEMEPHERIAEIAASPEGRIALERRRAGAPLTDAQRALLNEHDRLEASLNQTARRERPASFRVGSDVYGPKQRFIPAEVRRISELPPDQQVHAAREMRTKIMNDSKHPYFNENHPEHAQSVEVVRLLYGAEFFESGGEVLPDEK